MALEIWKTFWRFWHFLKFEDFVFFCQNKKPKNTPPYSGNISWFVDGIHHPSPATVIRVCGRLTFISKCGWWASHSTTMTANEYYELWLTWIRQENHPSEQQMAVFRFISQTHTHCFIIFPYTSFQFLWMGQEMWSTWWCEIAPSYSMMHFLDCSMKSQ